MRMWAALLNRAVVIRNTAKQQIGSMMVEVGTSDFHLEQVYASERLQMVRAVQLLHHLVFVFGTLLVVFWFAGTWVDP